MLHFSILDLLNLTYLYLLRIVSFKGLRETLMTLPHFLIIGVQKAGKSCLRYNLAQHPGIFWANCEINFFEKNFWEGLD